MTGQMDEKHLELIEKTEKFARERIAPWAAGRREEFPLDLWEEAGEAGLLGVAVPREYGGRGLGYLAVTAAVEALVATGHNPGFGLSWTIHNVVTRLVFWELARDDQRARYLPGLASGRISPSVSISEPGVGAHPRHLRTRAVGRDGEFILNGEKSYLTNGPFVELFVVLAITGGKEDRKEFSAFIVPKGTPGVALTPPLALDSFRPSPHCGIRLTDCAVPAANMIGAPGGAYQALAMAFREVEDVTLAGLISGGLTRRLALLIMELRRGAALRNEELARLGRLRYLRDTLRLLAFQAARLLDSAAAREKILSLMLSFRALAREFQAETVCLSPPSLEAEHEEFRALSADMIRAVNLAGRVLMLKQAKHGAALLRDEAVLFPPAGG